MRLRRAALDARRAVSLGTLVAMALVPCSSPSAATFYVDQSGGADSNDGLTWGTAKATIGSAITAATAAAGADVIEVAAGTYVERVVTASDLQLRGGYPAGGGARDLAANPTVVSGESTGSTVGIFGDAVVFEGFHVVGGTGDHYLGAGLVAGGILVRAGEDAVLRDLVVTNNELIDRCEARFDGTSCVVTAPTAHAVGAGLFAPGTRELVIHNVLLAGNRVAYDIIEDVQCTGMCAAAVVAPSVASTMFVCDSTVTISNLTVSDNTVANLPCEATVRVDRGSGTVSECIIYGNDALDYASAIEAQWSDIGTGLTTGVGNISAPPSFSSGALGPYYLSQIASGQAGDSPCVDAGGVLATSAGLGSYTTRTDHVGDSGTVDMGFHYPQDAVPSSDLFAIDLNGVPTAAIMSAAYGSACARLDPSSAGGRIAIAAPGVGSGAEFDAASGGADMTLYQLDCGFNGAITITKNPVSGNLVLGV